MVCLNHPALAATVRALRVVDGDTFVDLNHQKIRILGADTPELGHGFRDDEPLARQATAATTQLLTGHLLTLTPGIPPVDRYGRTLARVQLPDGRDVAEILLEQGLAMVMIYPPNMANIPRYLQVEAKARQLGKGIWRPTNHHLLTAQEAASAMGHYRLITGQVVSVDHAKTRTTLNFGSHRTTDFSVGITKRDWNTLFVPYGFTEKSLTGKRILVRGKIHQYKKGTCVTLTHPLQLQLLPS